MIAIRSTCTPWWPAWLLVMALSACHDEGVTVKDERPTRPIADVLADHTHELMAIDGVVAVGEGRLADGTPCIRVYLKRDDAALRKRIPYHLEGHPVEVAVSGEIRALPDSAR